MAGETIITVVGNLTAPPELRFTPNGAAVANFTVASTPRTFDRQANEWKDADTLFMRCSIWREAAENVAESLTKGTAVIATGTVAGREYETKEGERRTVFEVNLEAIGPDLRWATAKPVKVERGTSGVGAAQQSDPWATGGSAPQGGSGGQGGWGGNSGSQGASGGQGGWGGNSGGQGSGGQGSGGQSGSGNQGGWGNAPSYDEPPF